MPHFDERMNRLVTELHADADGLLLGRRTYDVMAGYWPGVPPSGLVLTRSETSSTGVAMLTYDRVDRLAAGSYAPV